VSVPVLAIVCDCGVPQILDVVIVPVAVPVRDVRLIVGSGSEERGGYEVVYVALSLLDRHAQVLRLPPLGSASQEPPRGALLVADDAAVVADLVVGGADDRAPFLGGSLHG
jgi:hypothetical protein